MVNFTGQFLKKIFVLNEIFFFTNYVQVVKINIFEQNVIPVITWSQVCTKQDSAISYVGLKLTHNVSTTKEV